MTNDLKRNLIRYVNNISETDISFITNIQQVLSIKQLCDILKINRNRYNYLIKNNQLNIEILTLRSDW